MAKKNNLRFVILGLLSQQELSGYDIKKLFETEINDFWYANHSQIYPELIKMEADGLITSRLDVVGEKLEKKYYSLTDEGRDALSMWLKEPLPVPAPSRDEFPMKLYLLNEASAPELPAMLDEELSRHENKLSYLQARQALVFGTGTLDPKDRIGHRCILAYAILRETNYITWLRQLRTLLPKR